MYNMYIHPLVLNTYIQPPMRIKSPSNWGGGGVAFLKGRWMCKGPPAPETLSTPQREPFAPPGEVRIARDLMFSSFNRNHDNLHMNLWIQRSSRNGTPLHPPCTRGAPSFPVKSWVWFGTFALFFVFFWWFFWVYMYIVLAAVYY